MWRLPPASIPDVLMQILPPLVDKWGVASASVAADWYDELRATQNIAGTFTAIVPPLDLGAEALAGWAAQPLTTPPPAPPVALVPPLAPSEMPPVQLDPLQQAQYRAEGGLQKRLVNAANLSVTTSAEQDPQATGYMRRTRRSDSYPAGCKFCLMLASRGSVYTRASATFAAHEHCFCEAVPAWGGQPLPVKPYKRSARPMSATDRARVRKWIADNL